MSARELTITATEFKAKCLHLLDELAQGRLQRIRITKRGKLVGEVRPPPAEGSLFGCMKGMITFAPGVDLMEPLSIPEPDDPFLGKPGDPLLERK